MEVVRGRVEIRARLAAARRAGRTIGLVPTMGNLHAGHAELVRITRARCDVVVVTIFVMAIEIMRVLATRLERTTHDLADLRSQMARQTGT